MYARPAVLCLDEYVIVNDVSCVSVPFFRKTINKILVHDTLNFNTIRQYVILTVMRKPLIVESLEQCALCGVCSIVRITCV